MAVSDTDVFVVDVDFRKVSIPTLPEGINADEFGPACPFCWPVFASIDEPDNKYKNDFRRLIRFVDSSIPLVFYLQKKIDGFWVDFTQITDDSFGDIYTNLRVRDNIKPRGLLLDFNKIISYPGLGVGSYRIRYDFTDFVDYSDEFCLSYYNDISADATTRIEFSVGSVVGSKFTDEIRDDYTNLGLTWLDQIRIPYSSIHPAARPYEKESLVRNSGFQNLTKQDFDRKAKLVIKGAAPELMLELESAFTNSDDLRLTDFNKHPVKGIGIYTDRGVQLDGDFDPGFRMDPTNGTATFDLVSAYKTTSKRFS